MKVGALNQEFQPVMITLETQGEVDAIFAVLNHHGLQEALGLSSDAWKDLDPYVSENYKAKHSAICAWQRGEI
jgi:hypothetical protein